MDGSGELEKNEDDEADEGKRLGKGNAEEHRVVVAAHRRRKPSRELLPIN